MKSGYCCHIRGYKLFPIVLQYYTTHLSQLSAACTAIFTGICVVCVVPKLFSSVSFITNPTSYQLPLIYFFRPSVAFFNQDIFVYFHLNS